MSAAAYRLPDGTIPVLLSADTPELLDSEATALRDHIAAHPDLTPGPISAMLFRTRAARRHRALAMARTRAELIDALQAMIDRYEHPALIRTAPAAIRRRIGYVFPGQGVQRPGMGQLFYESVQAFRAEVDRCAQAFEAQSCGSPRNYLLDKNFQDDGSAGIVQPALFTQMAALAAMWRSFGIAPNVTIGHSQGEVAAAYVSGTITLDDAVRVIGIRAHAADEFAAADYAMAIVAADRETCEDLLARCSGWAQLSVVNSPRMVGISGERETVQGIVDTLTERGTFARVIRVRYPAHTSLIHDGADKLRAAIQDQLQHPSFVDTDIDCLGATLGAPITSELPVGDYWFWNLRNIVRFDKAIAAAVQRDVETFVELAEHPTLQLAIHENLAALHDEADDRPAMVVGTSERTATDLGEFTRNLAQLAVHDLNYPWECLRAEPDGAQGLPLLDFPNTRMNEIRLWLPYDEVLPRRQPPSVSVAPAPPSVPGATADTTPARLLVEEWVRLSQRSLTPPRVVGIVDPTGACAQLATAMTAAAHQAGATARVVNGENDGTGADVNTLVILLPETPKLDGRAAAAEVGGFFSNRAWWPGVDTGVTDCWLVTVGGEAATAGDGPPDPVHAAASAGFRSIGAEHPGVGFRHLDLPAGATAQDWAHPIVAALHTANEPELAYRDGAFYAKRIVAGEGAVVHGADACPEHVLIIGGTGNLGLEFCDHFAHRGARRITLVSRSGESAAVAERLAQLRSATAAQIAVTRCDVGDPAAVSRLAAQHRSTPADLIIHAAVAYSSVEFSDITIDDADNALYAKVVGIGQVLDAFPRTDGCRIVLCSSARATIGGRGQVMYAAANRMLDAMAHRLRAEGLDCVSVQWGQWTVHFDLDASSMAQLAAIGVIPMPPAEAIALGMQRLGRNAIVAAFDFDRARPVLETFGYGPLVSELLSPVSETAAPAEQADLPGRLSNLLATAIGAERAERIDTSVPMVALGLDSLQALELRRRVKAEFDHELEVSDLLGGASIADVLAQLGAR